MGLNIDAAAYSHIGGRKNNEDNFFLNGVYLAKDKMDNGGQCSAAYAHDVQIYAVCDGMGGAMYGEEASHHAVKVLSEYLAECANPSDKAGISVLLNEISDGINDISEANGLAAGESGSTIAMLIIQDDSYRTVHVGDSRIYRLRQGEFKQITRDHSQVQEMLDAGIISADEAWRHPLKNIITQHLGMARNMPMHPDISDPEPLLAGDKFIICSDGLSDVVRDTQMAEMLREEKAPAASSAELVRRALNEAANFGVSSDNVTVIRLDVFEGSEQDQKKLRRLGFLKRLLGSMIGIMTAGAVGMGFMIAGFMMR